MSTLGLKLGPASPERKAKISAALRGRTFSLERRARLSTAHMGQTPWNKGKRTGPLSAGHKAKLSERVSAAKKGKTVISIEQRARLRVTSTRHGRRHAPEYGSYYAARTRCLNPKYPHFKDYGGRGIKFLYQNFEAFFADLGPRPPGTSIDRVDPDGHYGPGGCRWATPKEQTGNRRKKERAA